MYAPTLSSTFLMRIKSVEKKQQKQKEKVSPPTRPHPTKIAPLPPQKSNHFITALPQPNKQETLQLTSTHFFFFLSTNKSSNSIKPIVANLLLPVLPSFWMPGMTCCHPLTAWCCSQGHHDNASAFENQYHRLLSLQTQTHQPSDIFAEGRTCSTKDQRMHICSEIRLEWERSM